MKAGRQRLWLVIGVETVVLIALAAWILTRLDRLLEPFALLVGAAIVIAGDVATAFIMQRLAPTAILVEPGERAGGTAVAAADFDASGRGLVLLRGERWNARARTGASIRRGDRVRVQERDGLTLVVEPAD
ncbi:MAG: NfeD family protein [Gammaproteobacteria bacterium]|nr:NfeD family protein [Gammaproteobacteria bacterium]